MRRTLCAVGLVVSLCACSSTPAPGGAPPGSQAGSPRLSVTTTVTSAATSARSSGVRSFAAGVVGRTVREGGSGEGFAAVAAGVLETVNLEGTGGIRWVDPRTGAVQKSVADQRARTMSGVAVAEQPGGPGVVWQLMLRDGVAVARDPASLGEVRRAEFRGEGWGLCAAGDRLVQSDGSARLVVRDAATFAEVGAVTASAGWWSSSRLGELECVQVDGRLAVWAVLAGTSWMIRVDAESGTVSAVADLAAVMAAVGEIAPEQTINAVAAVPGAAGEFWVSGTGWRSMLRVRLSPRP